MMVQKLTLSAETPLFSRPAQKTKGRTHYAQTWGYSIWIATPEYTDCTKGKSGHKEDSLKQAEDIFKTEHP